MGQPIFPLITSLLTFMSFYFSERENDNTFHQIIFPKSCYVTKKVVFVMTWFLDLVKKYR